MHSAFGSLAFTALLAGAFSSKSVIAESIPADLHQPIYDVWDFSNDTWLENIGVRSNGQLLVSFLTQPDIYQLDPAKIKQPALVYRFPTLSTFAITELSEDVYGIIAGNYSLATETNYPGSYSVWKLDLRNFHSTTNGTIISPATASKITDIPGGGLLNGMIRLGDGDEVLIADSYFGQVWKLNTGTGEYSIIQKDPIMDPVPGPFPIGINGIHILDGYLYFTNTYQYLFVKVPIYTNGTAAGPYEIIRSGLSTDDFILDSAGNAYLAELHENTIRTINRQNTTFDIVAGNSSLIDYPTAVQFGRTPLFENHIFVSNGGGAAVGIRLN